MNKYNKFTILCVLFLVVRDLCNGDSKGKDVSASIASRPDGFVGMSDGDLFKSIWQNSKRRRSVKSVVDTIVNPRFECGDRGLALFLNHEDATKITIYGRK